MWNSITGFVGSTIETYGASTQRGHDAIKNRLIAKIDEMSTLVDEQTAKMDEIESLESDEDLKTILNELAGASQELMTDLRKDTNLAPIVTVLADRLYQLGGVEALKRAVEDSESAQQLKGYALKLVDIDNYSSLLTLVTKLQNFSKLKKGEKEAIRDQIESGELVKKIQAENNNLKPDAVKKRVRTLVGNVCKDLELSVDHKNSLLTVFDRVIDKHLKEFNPIREQLVKKLPEFLTTELKRVSGTKKVAKKDKQSVTESEVEIDTKKAFTPARKLGQAKGGQKRPATVHAKPEENEKKKVKPGRR